MSKYVKNQDSSDPWMIEESNQSWLLGKNATISVSGTAAINVVAGYDNNLVKIRGDIEAKGAAAEGMHVEGSGTTVKIKASSLIESREGIHNNGIGNLIENSGIIDGKDLGIDSDYGVDIVNDGRISAETAITLLGQSSVTNLKGGLIEGDGVGIRIGAFGSATVTNRGKITADDVAVDVNTFGDSYLTNTGKIIGDVIFGAGDDSIRTASGKIAGEISGGLGSDSYTIGKGKYNLSEDAGSGYDTVYTSANHALRANFEMIQLSGEKSINGTGNGLNNVINGNDADNVLRGKGGHDNIRGNSGDDFMIGDGGFDCFIFDEDFDRDTVGDFDIEQDLLVVLVPGFDSFDDVASHISQHGNDTWISFGDGDRIILQGIDAGDVTDDVVAFNIPM